MQYNYVTEGVIISNKVDGQEYIIHEESGRFFLYPTKQGQELEVPEGYEPVEVTRDNAICFRYLYNPNTPACPDGDWEVLAGLLYRDGEVFCEQGEIVVKTILGIIPGALVLIADSKAEGRENLMVYRPDRDKFIYVNNCPEGTILPIADVHEGLVIAWYKTGTEEIITEAEDGTEIRETKEVFVEAGNAFVTRNTKWVISHDLPLDAYQTEMVGDEYIAVPLTKEMTTEGFVEPARVNNFRFFELKTGAAAAMASIDIPEGAEPYETRLYPDPGRRGNFIARGKDFYSDSSWTISTKCLEGKDEFLYMVDNTMKDNTSTMTFADPNCNVLRIMRTYSRDRGFIDTIL